MAHQQFNRDDAEVAIELALEQYRCPLFVTIRYSERMTVSAGIAHVRKRRGELVGIIVIGLPYWRLADAEDRENTVYHEVAHLLHRWLKGQWGGHRREWIQIMLSLGQEPRRYHYVDLRETISCSHCKREYKLSLACYRRWVKGTTKYWCHCKEPITPPVA